MTAPLYAGWDRRAPRMLAGPLGGTPVPVGVPLLPESLTNGLVAVEVAWTADRTDSDGSTWTWVDITTDVRHDPGISCFLGRNDESSTSNPATLSLVLDNTSGEYSQGGRSANWPYVRRGVPVRARVDPGDGSGLHVLWQGAADGWTPGWDALTGTIPTVQLEASGTLRRLIQGEAPLSSALRRELTDTASVIAYWPCEEGKNAASVSAIRGGGDAALTELVKFADDGEFNCSDPLPVMGAGGSMFFPVAPYTDTGELQIRWLSTIPDNLADGVVLAYVYFAGGGVGRIDLTYEVVGGTGGIGVFAYDPFGTLLFSYTGAVDPFPPGGIGGRSVRYSLEAEQMGADLYLQFGVATPNIDGTYDGNIYYSFAFTSPNLTSRTLGKVTHIDFAPLYLTEGVSFGHVSVETVRTSLTSQFGALQAHLGEFPTTAPGGRISRLTTENGVYLEYIPGNGATAVYDGMAEQRSLGLLTLLRECEASDQGQLFDGRGPGLTYVTRRFREDGYVGITLDAAAGQLAPAFEPTDDDQRTRNRVSVTCLDRGTATVEDVTGPLGTEAIGFYDDSRTISNSNDPMAEQYAGWFVSLGTAQGYRYPSITIDMNASPALAADVLALHPGKVVEITNASAVLDTFPEDTLSLIIEGIRHSISPHRWRTTLLCSAYAPWGVALLPTESGDEGDLVLRLSDDGLSALAADAAAGAMSTSVATSPPPIVKDFETAGSAGFVGTWTRTSLQSHSGSWSLRSGVIPDSGTTDVTLDVRDATTIQFWYRVSSESGFDFFRFLIDGVQQFQASGTVGWTPTATIDVSSATTVTFRYIKDTTTSAGEDAAYIDDVVLTPNPALWPTGLADLFDDGTVGALWSGSYGTYSEVGGRARVQCDTGYSAVATAAVLDLAPGTVSVRIYPPADGGAAQAVAQMLLMSSTAGTDLMVEVDTGAATPTITFANRVGYFDATATSLTYSATNHAYVRVVVAGASTTFDTSPDGTTWTTRKTISTPAWLSSGTDLAIQLLAHRDGGTVDFAEFGEFRLGVAGDDFPFDVEIGGLPVRVTGIAGASSPQTFTVDALPVARSANLPVVLHDPPPLSL